MGDGMTDDPTLKKGQRIQWPGSGGVYEVLRITECSATVRPVKRDQRTVNGREFKATPRPIQISAKAEVEVVG